MWGLRAKGRAKVMGALRDRGGESRDIAGELGGKIVLIHAVSVGEMNATKRLVEELAARDSSLRFYVTATTETGYARAKELYAGRGDTRVGRFPLDFLANVRRTLDAVRPAAVLLVELELWPNFIEECRARNVPVVVVNGRMTAASARRYKWMGFVGRQMFGGLAAAGVQDEVNRKYFTAAGVPAERVSVTGTMKFDTATVGETVEGAEQAAAGVGLRAGDRVWVAGSTGSGEEEMVLRVYKDLREKIAGLRVVIVPRKPERFDEVAGLIRAAGFGCTRRSEGKIGGDSDVMLIDTMGELRKFYAVATVVFVGRTLVDLGPKQHGSDMIEPAALGKVPVVGPFTANFADAMGHLRAGGGVVEVADEQSLTAAMRRLLGDAEDRMRLGRAARDVVVAQRGSTLRNVPLVLAALV